MVIYSVSFSYEVHKFCTSILMITCKLQVVCQDPSAFTIFDGVCSELGCVQSRFSVPVCRSYRRNEG